MRNAPRRKPSGFSLIEVIFAIAMLGIGIVGVLSLFTAGLTSASKAANSSSASMEVQSLLTRILTESDGDGTKPVSHRLVLDRINVAGNPPGSNLHPWIHFETKTDGTITFSDSEKPARIDPKRDLFWKCLCRPVHSDRDATGNILDEDRRPFSVPDLSAADLAIGHAAALQRQLDESLQKLSWLERDQAGRSGIDEKIAQLGAQLDDAENRARAADQQARAAEAHAREYADRIRDGVKRATDLEAELEATKLAEQSAQAQVEDLEGQAHDAQSVVRELEAKVRASEQRSNEVDTRARDIEQRAKDAAERIVDSERRARDAANQVVELSELLAAAEAQIGDIRKNGTGNNAGLERQLAAAQQRIGELQREVDAAENVRQFAANTEREIAQLERELRETKTKAAQVALERDNLESQLRDLREDDETNARGVPEAPAVDLSRYTQLVSRSAELEQRNLKLEKEQVVVRRLLAEAEAKVEAQQRAREDEPTNTGNAMPIEFAEHLNILEESIDSLKANMRAASDETAMMEQSDSVAAVSQAVSQAAEHVERARDALKILTVMVAKQ